MDEERRKRLLTDADVAAIGEAVATMLPRMEATCRLGLTADDAVTLKSHLGVWKKATSIIGTVILTTIAVFLVGIFTKGFWMSLIEGIKK